MSYQIITDSSCDFTQEQYQALNVAHVDMTLLYNGEEHSNFTEPDQVKAFYDLMRSGVMATTAAVNPDGWVGVMEPFLAQGQDVLVLAFSSGLSTTYQSACIAAGLLSEQYPERTIRVVDTLCAALGQGLLVWHACQKRDAGMGLLELTAWVEENRFHLCHWVTVDDLAQLKRGGRISATTALVGTMMNVKPIIHMDNEGKLINCAKVRGRKAATEYIAAKLGQTGQDFDNDTIAIGHGDCPEEAQALAELLREKYGAKNIITGYVGPVIGAHIGPGVLVVFFMGEHR